jgi:hypothetical protein
MSSSIPCEVAEPGLTAATLRPPRSCYDQRGQRLAFYVLGDDQQGLLPAPPTRAWAASAAGGELLLVTEQLSSSTSILSALAWGRDIAAVELHALHDVELGLQAVLILDCDYAFVADLLHGPAIWHRSPLSPLAEMVPTQSRRWR